MPKNCKWCHDIPVIDSIYSLITLLSLSGRLTFIVILREFFEHLFLLPFVEIRLFNVFFRERKAGCGKLMKNVRDGGSGPPFHTLLGHKSPQHKKTANRLNFWNFLSKLLFLAVGVLGVRNNSKLWR